MERTFHNTGRSPKVRVMTDAMMRHDPTARSFASDNYAGIHPEVLAALALANGGHQPSYGADAYTEALQPLLRRHFGPTAVGFPVFNGTGANVVALQAMTQRWGAVIAAESSHLNHDECGAVERVGGLKVWLVDASVGKLTPELIGRQAYGMTDVHRAQPQVVSLTQATELGTCYRPDEIAAVTSYAHQHGLRVHMDGARLANAAATLELPLRALTTDVGVDVVSFGGTKNGMLAGEVVLVLNPGAVVGVDYLRKMSMQLGSKMRFLSVQCEALLAGDLWLRNAQHANAMAQLLAASIGELEPCYPVEANSVFVRLPAEVTRRLQQQYPFYVWDEATGVVRWMTSFDTTPTDVAAFATAINAELAT